MEFQNFFYLSTSISLIAIALINLLVMIVILVAVVKMLRLVKKIGRTFGIAKFVLNNLVDRFKN